MTPTLQFQARTRRLPSEAWPHIATRRPFVATLRDGSPVRIRPVREDDSRRLIDGLQRLSPRSRYLRFHRHVDELSDANVRYLTDLDQRRHVAWGAVALDEPGEPGLGVARYVREPTAPHRAKLAVTVVDEYQRIGLGRLLLDTLMLSALESGVVELSAQVLPENTGAIRLFERAGAQSFGLHAGVLTLVIPIASPERTTRLSGALTALPPDPEARSG